MNRSETNCKKRYKYQNKRTGSSDFPIPDFTNTRSLIHDTDL